MNSLSKLIPVSYPLLFLQLSLLTLITCSHCPPPHQYKPCHCNGIKRLLNCSLDFQNPFPEVQDWTFQTIILDKVHLTADNLRNVTTNNLFISRCIASFVADISVLTRLSYQCLIMLDLDQVLIDQLLDSASDLVKTITLNSYDSDRLIEFANFPNLEYVTIDTKLFGGDSWPTKLKYKRLADNSFATNTKLQAIMIDGAGLEVLGQNSLSFCSENPMELYLEDNLITTEQLIRANLTNFPNQLDVDLVNNQVDHLPRFFSRYCQHSMRVNIDLTDNPIRCLPDEIDWFFEEPDCKQHFQGIVCVNVNRNLTDLTLEELRRLTSTRDPRLVEKAWFLCLVSFIVLVAVVWASVCAWCYCTRRHQKTGSEATSSEVMSTYTQSSICTFDPKVPLPPLPVMPGWDSKLADTESIYGETIYQQIDNEHGQGDRANGDNRSYISVSELRNKRS